MAVYVITATSSQVCCLMDLLLMGVPDVLLRAGVALLRILEERVTTGNSAEDLVVGFKGMVRGVDAGVLLRATLCETPGVDDTLFRLARSYSALEHRNSLVGSRGFYR